MHCRAVTARVKAGKTEEAIDLYEKSVVPAARLQKGFQDAYLMVDPATGRALSISIWDSQSDMVGRRTRWLLPRPGRQVWDDAGRGPGS